MNLGLKGPIQYLNSSLALQIANYWISYISKFKNNWEKLKGALSKKFKNIEGGTNFDKYKWMDENKSNVSINEIPIIKSLKLNESFIKGIQFIKLKLSTN